jgi:hypothetical protein
MDIEYHLFPEVRGANARGYPDGCQGKLGGAD